MKTAASKHVHHSSARETLKVRWEQLRRTFRAEEVSLEGLAEQTPEGLVGQQRALAALKFGLQIKQPGFNVFVAGEPGLGKTTSARAFMETEAAGQPTPSDWCYVHNFDDPYRPRALQLPAGQGRELCQDMVDLIERLRTGLPKEFESEQYVAQREAIFKTFHAKKDEVLQTLHKEALDLGFSLQQAPHGLAMVALEEVAKAVEPEELVRRSDVVRDKVAAAFKAVRKVDAMGGDALKALEQKVALTVVEALVEDLLEKYRELPPVGAYLTAVQHDVLSILSMFRTQEGPADLDLDLFRRYRVNLLVDNSRRTGAPVVTDRHPTYGNLLGRIERESHQGTLTTDVTLIRPGTLHEACGGYLLVTAEDVLRTPFAWETLKRALIAGSIQIEDLGEELGLQSVRSLRPEPIPLQVKVVMVGSPLLYHLLLAHDPQFSELFKVKADFDTCMPCTAETRREYLAFLCHLCKEETGLALDAGGAACLLEHAVRLAGDQERLSTRYGWLADVMREAHFWASQAGAQSLSEQHVKHALDAKVFRSNLLETRLREATSRGFLLVTTQGHAVGQVNGLSVIDMGDYAFGHPTRITAEVQPGGEGVIDIEREVELGGPIHSKGVMILAGYLGWRYAHNRPLALQARLAFEQSYAGVEGDSASSAEVFAILSALADLPVDQGIAVTGSVNQHGEVQAIGGINEKIEGMFDLCRVQGLTGQQGVIVPHSNLQHLMLREDVVAAVREGRFHVWAISHVDEGMEILTGVRAGQKGGAQGYPADTVNGRVERCLQRYSSVVHPEEKDPSGNGKASRVRASVPNR